MRTLRWLHIWAGLAASLMIVVISVTGILLVHRKELQLSQIMIPMQQSGKTSDIDAWSGASLSDGSLIVAARQGVFVREAGEWRLAIPEQGRIVVRGDHRIWAGTRGGLYVSEDQGVNWYKTDAIGDIRALSLERDIGYAASTTALFRIRGSKVSEISRFPRGFAEVRQIIAGVGRITLVTKSGIVEFGESGELLNVGPRVAGPSKVELQKLIADLHAGTLFGSWYLVVVDATAVSLVLLTLSGLGIYAIPRWRKRELKRKCQASLPDNA